VRDSGSCALEIVQGRVRVLEREGRHSAAKLWREIEAAIEKLPAIER